MSEQKKLQQENFEILNNGPRKKIVRQDRFPIEAGTCFVQIGDDSFEVTNLSSFGLAFVVPSTKQTLIQKLKGETISNCALSVKGFNFHETAIRIARLEKNPISAIDESIAGCEVLDSYLIWENFQAVRKSMQILSKIGDYFTTVQEIPKSFSNAIIEFKNILEQFKSQLDLLEKQIPTDNTKANSDYRDTVAQVISNHFGKLMPDFYQKLPPLFDGMTPETREKCNKFAQSQLGPYIYGAPFANRAFYKPRGYAGDFEMMNQLYRDNIAGASLFDQTMHRYFIDEPAGEAVKNRGKYLLEKIHQTIQNSPPGKTVKIVSIASGPALEIQLFVSEAALNLGKKVEFHLIDQDEEALKHAQREILSIERFRKTGYEFHFHNLAIKNILVAGVPIKDCDLIYSAGLFDYFTDPVATAAAQKIVQAIKPGGQAIIGNFSKDNPCSPFMEMVLEWHLIYRSSEDLVRIFSPVGKKIEIEFEPLKINLFAVLRN